MNLRQITTSVENLLLALDESELSVAVERFKQCLINGHVNGADDELTAAASRYMDCAAAFDKVDEAVIEKLHLNKLQSPAFWFDLSTPVYDRALRLADLEMIQNQLTFATEYLPRLLTLSDVHGPVSDEKFDEENAVIRIRINHAVEKASYPDRISRLIDGVDMIYQACAELADESTDDLELVSVSGMKSKTAVFRGHPEVATATRRIIRAVYQQAAITLREQTYSVEQIAEQIPFMHAIDELFRIKALDADSANGISEGVLAGSIMLLECGARLHGDSKAREFIDGKPARALQSGPMGNRVEEIDYLTLNPTVTRRPVP